MTKVVTFSQSRKIIIFFVVISSLFLMFVIPLSRVLKQNAEITRIKSKSVTHVYCVQYALVATANGYYPCFNCPSGSIYLHIGDIWKYGKTCNGEAGRYPSGLPYKNLTFQPQLYGNNIQCLVEEKFKIYSYPLLPECKNRDTKLIRPPGNKIDR